MVTARFDDLRPRRRRSFALHAPREILAAETIDQVVEVLEEVERAVQDGAWVAGYVAYEAAPAFDRALAVRDLAGTRFARLPLAWFSIHDRRRPSGASERLPYRLAEWRSTESRAEHAAAIERIRRLIRQGETYQVNHTFRLEAEFSGDPTALYRDLAHSQTCGYGSYLDTGDWVIASASPELFFEWRHGLVVSRPMKGTARRGLDLAGDELARARLAVSEKDRAENLMIVDMVRNDLGRIAGVGSVQVPELFTTEKYDTVWQMTSTVTGRPRPATNLTEVFTALFPGASITGAPKVATMDIIRRLETTPRGVYCGAIGFGGPGPAGPEWAFNVAIRTVVVDLHSGLAHYGTGGGITFDSTAGGEYEEALLKARVLDRRSAEFQLVETILWEPNGGFRHLHRHLGRLSDSAWYFDVPLDPAEVRSALDGATRGHQAARVVRLLVDRTGWISVEVMPVPPPASEPIRLVVDDRPVPADDPFLRHKTTNRTWYDEAGARHPQADDVVLWNPAGNVTETTIANLAVRIDGAWLTPPVADGLLAGTERAARLEAGQLREHSVSVEELRRAEGVARLNSVRGWEPAVVVG